jgi:hypothetical protein
LKENLNKISTQIDSINKLLGELKEIIKDEKTVSGDIIGFSASVEDVKQLKKEQKTCDGNLSYYKLKCIDNKVNVVDKTIPEIISSFSNNPSLEPYYSLDEEKVKTKIEELKIDVKRNNDSIERNEVLITTNQNELDKLKKMKPHEYEKYNELFKDLLIKLPKLSGLITNEYRKMLERLIDNKEQPIDMSKSKKNDIVYYDKVGNYLAQLVGKFYYLDGQYEPTKIDLINSIIHTKEGTNVPINLQGTGHGQATYLMGLLNSQDKRIMIALFDEIGSIDLFTLENTVFQKINELYKANKLLVGILVHKLDKKEANIINLESY